MKKILLFILILFPTYVMSEEYELVHPKDLRDLTECKYNISMTGTEECVTKEKYEKFMRLRCGLMSAQAKSDFSARKIYKTCLEKEGVLDK